MIILYPKNINQKFVFFLSNYELNNFYSPLKCPHCCSQDLIRWGSYNRNLIYLEDNVIKYKLIKIKRVRCKTCGKTHALLPAFLVPYKIHTLDIILNCLSNQNTHLSISSDTIINWNKQFKKFVPYLKTMFENISKLEIINKLKENIFKHYKQYFDQNHKILMLTRLGVFNMVPF